MSEFICPVCKQNLSRDGKVYNCPLSHSFDISKYGYVNLLMSQQSSSKRHGDDKLMVRARRDFLSLGLYGNLRGSLVNAFNNHVKGGVVVDVGCGEGYYSSAICENSKVNFYGIDISKDALRFASSSVPTGEFAVASAFNLPFNTSSVDCVLSVFAPSAYEEFYRVLKNDGVLIKAVPLEEHLWELKSVLYNEPYKNKPEIRNDELFELISCEEIKYTIELTSSQDIENLFKMTPYYYKTGREDAQKLLEKTSLSTTVHFGVEVYRKR